MPGVSSCTLRRHVADGAIRARKSGGECFVEVARSLLLRFDTVEVWFDPGKCQAVPAISGLSGACVTECRRDCDPIGCRVAPTPKFGRSVGVKRSRE